METEKNQYVGLILIGAELVVFGSESSNMKLLLPQ